MKDRRSEEKRNSEKKFRSTTLNQEGSKLKINREISRITFFFAALFFAMIVYFVVFEVKDAKTVIKNPANGRNATTKEDVSRGKILSSSGHTLAVTKTDKDGNEYRSYPYKNLFAHVVGVSSYGSSGLELAFNNQLMTSNVSLKEKVKNEANGDKNPGNSIVTTLDMKLTKAAYDAFGDYDGAFVAMDAESGEILSMLSKPDYNPNELLKDYESVTSGEDSVLLNRATQGKYTPGSIFKTITTLAYMDQGFDLDEFTYRCKGSLSFDTKDNYKISCFDGEAHGYENLENAFAYSCNGAYATIGQTLDVTSFQSLCEKLLFNRDLPLDLEWKKSSISLSKDSNLFDVTQTAIGQGTTQVTPIHMCMLASAIANDGVLMTPYLVSQVVNENGETLKTYSPKKYKDMMTSSQAETLQDFMEATVEYGTAKSLNSSIYKAAGKTGTAELDKNDNVNSWFIGYFTMEDRKIAVACVLENLPAGGKTATNVLKTTFDTYASQ